MEILFTSENTILIPFMGRIDLADLQKSKLKYKKEILGAEDMGTWKSPSEALTPNPSALSTASQHT